jgi:26S proteasome non-ATPase regulatory subunit 5
MHFRHEFTPNTEKILQKLCLEVPVKQGTTSIVQLIMPLMHSPFAELRYSLFDALNGLVAHKWGLQEVLNYPGFYEFITNRSTETTKPGKEWKYTVIQTMARTSSKHTDALDITRRKELELYLQQGVFFIKAESRPEIASETS